MNLDFYRKSGEYTLLSWKRMLPGLSDTFVTLALGTLVMKVASIVLIFVLTLNIALSGFSSLVLMHRRPETTKIELGRLLIQAAICVAVSLLIIGLVARALFGSAIGGESLLFLALSLPRPFLVVWNTYTREILFREKRHSKVHAMANISVFIYVGGSWAAFFMAHFLNLKPTILWLLFGVYINQIYLRIAGTKALTKSDRLTGDDLIAMLRTILTPPASIYGIRVALSNTATNVMEFGYLGLAGWIVTACFHEVAPLYFALFTLFEWASGLALGLSRVYTERRIAKEAAPPLSQITLVFGIYSIAFVALYLFVMSLISKDFSGLGKPLILFSAFYVFFDGTQLVLRAFLLAQEDGGRLLHNSTLTYGIAFAGLIGVWALATRVDMLFLALVAPLLLTTALLSYEVRRLGMASATL